MLGGRPMKKICYYFEDVVEGRPVYLWLDKLGRYWLAQTRWGWFRVPNIHGPEIWLERTPGAAHE